ncbi:MAG: DEAD/DEAH box helicase [Desulfovibrio sp.]|jgi:DEAD/DEAH box helicase domain-containing protein|nr:DEAD/DEAH box helicase [Desulfovibrio sp.]
MSSNGSVAEYLEALEASQSLGPQITGHVVLPASPPRLASLARPWPRAMDGVLEHLGIRGLYSHQAEGIDALRAGRNIIVSTPTASGKSLIYTLPVLENFLRDPDARALFLFPLKALARDQLAAFESLCAHWPDAARPAAAVYDGDTTGHFRRKIRDNLPQVLFTNPEMLHLSLLPHHRLWAELFAGLTLVVADEAHTCRGVYGAHTAQLFRRLRRVASHYGASPVFALCSATVGNPEELARLLTGAPAAPVRASGAPQGRRHYIFINPLESPASTAVKLLKSALARGLRSIVYCQSRRMTELVGLWAAEKSGAYAGRISAYRAGFLPEERRDIERRMASGELLAVISTSALELGIDVGSLDICILVGYPGTIMSTLQRGGRVGRAGQEAAVLLVAGEDALDQYIVRHAGEFFDRPPEKAILNPDNPVIMERHLECAAAELPLRPDVAPDKTWMSPEALAAVAALEHRGLLLRSADGAELYAARKRPQRGISLRGSGGNVVIETASGELIGVVDGVRAVREAHPGSIYLHLGRHFEITELDLGAGRALARPFRPSWYTRARGHKETEILSLDESCVHAGAAAQRGRLRITDFVTGYEKRSVRNGQLLGVLPLQFPPLVFETEGLWILVPPHAQEAVEQARLHFMGAIHALEHAAIGLLPLQVMADRNDFGGISTPMHAQTGRPTVFVYDGIPGGAGLSRAAFDQIPDLLRRVLAVIRECPCETGCPSCVHSPKCGSGNRPIDKEGAACLLEALLTDTPACRDEAALLLQTPPSGLPASSPAFDSGSDSFADGREADPGSALGPTPRISMQGTSEPEPERPKEKGEGQARHIGCAEASGSSPERPGESGGEHNFPVACRAGEEGVAGSEVAPVVPYIARRSGLHCPGQEYVVLDVETRRSAAEVGGWHKAGAMGVSVAVLYDSRTDAFSAYGQEDIPALAAVLEGAPLVVGFNLLRFDYAVLAPHAPGCDFRRLPTLDMLLKIHEQLSYRLSLDNLARATLNNPKSADGLTALRWWREGRTDLIEAYCRQDVAATRDLYVFGRQHGYLLFTNKAGRQVRVRAAWQDNDTAQAAGG